MTMKFDFEGLNISIDPSGKFVIDSIFDSEGNNVQIGRASCRERV